MRILGATIRLLSPLQYYSTQSIGGMRTAPFIGDIALTYSLAHNNGLINYPPFDRFQPNYKEIREFPFLFTVAVPIALLTTGEFTANFMKQLRRNTMLGIDYNGTNKFPGYRDGSNMYKNFYFVQMLKPDHILTFHAGLIIKGDLSDLPKALRLGNGKMGLVSVEFSDPPDQEKFYINRYTVENIYGKKLKNITFKNIYHPVHQYYIVGPVSKNELLEVFE